MNLHVPGGRIHEISPGSSNVGNVRNVCLPNARSGRAPVKRIASYVAPIPLRPSQDSCVDEGPSSRAHHEVLRQSYRQWRRGLVLQTLQACHLRGEANFERQLLPEGDTPCRMPFKMFACQAGTQPSNVDIRYRGREALDGCQRDNSTTFSEPHSVRMRWSCLWSCLELSLGLSPPHSQRMWF